MARSGDWRKGHGTKSRSERGYEPVAVGPVKRAPACDPLARRRQSHAGPGGPQRDQERTVHHTFQVGGKSLGTDPGGKEVWELFVQDNGIGFDEKYLDRIFRMLERLHTREEFEGTGMGLAICRRIAERGGGGITAQSRPGEGARFIVTLKTEAPVPVGAQ